MKAYLEQDNPASHQGSLTKAACCGLRCNGFLPSTPFLPVMKTQRPHLSLIICFTLLLTLGGAMGGDIILLESTDGRSILGQILKQSADSVLVQRADGQSFEIPLSRLTAATVKKIQAAKPSSVPPALGDDATFAITKVEVVTTPQEFVNGIDQQLNFLMATTAPAAGEVFVVVSYVIRSRQATVSCDPAGDFAMLGARGRAGLMGAGAAGQAGAFGKRTWMPGSKTNSPLWLTAGKWEGTSLYTIPSAKVAAAAIRFRGKDYPIASFLPADGRQNATVAAAGAMPPPVQSSPNTMLGGGGGHYTWRSPSADIPVFAEGIVVKDVVKNGARQWIIKGAPGGKGSVPFVGDRQPIDNPGSKDVRIEIDAAAGSTTYAGLSFTTPCVLEILPDGTLLADKEGVVARDRAGKEWTSQRQVLKGMPAIVFTSASKATSFPALPAEAAPAAAKWPALTSELSGGMEVRVRNPNEFSVKVGLRSGGKGKDFTVAANGVKSAYVPNGSYDIYFQYSTDPDGLYQGDSFTLRTNGVEIKIVKVVNGNYGIRKVR